MHAYSQLCSRLLSDASSRSDGWMLLQQVGFGALVLPIIGVMEVIAIGKAFGQFVLFTISISSCSLLSSSGMHDRHRIDEYL